VQNLRGRTIQYNILQRDVDTNRALYEGLLQRYKEVGVAGGVTANNIAIIDRAEPSPGPSSPRPLLNFAVALAGGAFVAVALAFLVDALDQVLTTPDDVAARIGLPILGVIPLAAKRTEVAALLADRRSGLSESYYSLRSMLQFSTEAGFPRSLLVTSTGPGEGKSTTAYALATILARLGYKTVLVDADLRNPSLQKEFDGLHNSTGLTNLLTSAGTLAEVVQDSGTPNLTIITSGPLPPSPAELLGTQTFHRTVAAISAGFDIVIIDGPPVMGLADAPLIAAAVNATLLVVEASMTGRTQALAAVGRLQMAHAKLVGAVLTKFDLRNASYGYGYAYQYAYGYGAANNDRGGPSLLSRITRFLRR
jgi:capsular exopolysaccharide synthesis family protein